MIVRICTYIHTLCGANSTAKHLVSISTAALLVQYDAHNRNARSAATLARLTIAPPFPRETMSFATTCKVKQTLSFFLKTMMLT